MTQIIPKSLNLNVLKNYLLLLTILILQACSSTKNANSLWVGESKQKIISNWGPPIRTVNNEKGQMLIYADQIYNNKNSGSTIAGPSHWSYTYVYIDKAGIIYSLKNEEQKLPPQEIEVKISCL